MKDLNKFELGAKVRYIGNDGKRQSPKYAPPIGSIGTIVDFEKYHSPYIQWPKGSTSDNDRWYCHAKFLELVESGTDYLETRVRFLEERVGTLESMVGSFITTLLSRK